MMEHIAETQQAIEPNLTLNPNLNDPSLFEPLSPEERRGAEFMRPSQSYWQDAWRRLRQDRLAFFGLVVILIILLAVVVGLGVSAPMASWGVLSNDAIGSLAIYPWQLFFPAAAISVTILAFNFLGDGLRDALDPRLRK